MSKKSISNIVKDFLEFEAENSLFSVRINGYNLWEYIRYEVSTEIINSSLDFNLSLTAYNKKRKFHKYPILLIKYIIIRCQKYFLSGKYQFILINTSRRN